MRHSNLLLFCMLLLLALLAGCGRPSSAQQPSASGSTPAQATAFPRPTQTQPPTATALPASAGSLPDGWQTYQGRGVTLALPASFIGGDPSEDVDILVEKIQALGPEFEQGAQFLQQNPETLLLWAVDSELSEAGTLATVNIVSEKVMSAVTLDLYAQAAIKQLPASAQVLAQADLTIGDHAAKAITLELAELKVKEILYIIKNGKQIWIVIYAAGSDDFEQRLPLFAQSVQTFSVQPES